MSLAELPPSELVARARAIRDESHGKVITFSPKVFIPLTKLCRDRCGYCTFAQAPARLEAPYMDQDEVLQIASRGAAAGCHEALFTLGEAPEARYAAAREWLDARGFGSTVEYLIAMCELVISETGLLPHANAGALSEAELERLRDVAPSQGMMVESLNPGLAAHRGAPDKDPARRLETLDAAGRLEIPFTTGILVGIGESRSDRIAALEAIADSHRRHGHVQEVIVQNFLPKPGTAMHSEAPCPVADHIDAVALARVILPAEVHVQAPPNLSEDLDALLDAGVSDWGGVSPVTADHVNPERPWPSLDSLRSRTEAAGFSLVPRLTVHPSYVVDSKRWISEPLQFPVMDRSDASGFARDDPGAQLPPIPAEDVRVDDDGEVMLPRDRQTCWYAGAPVEPPSLVAGGDFAVVGGRVGEVLDGVLMGHEPGEEELLALFDARGSDVSAICAVADDMRQAIVGDAITFVANRNINYTNICTFKCKFCGFSKGPLSLSLRGKPYLLSLDELRHRVTEAVALGATEVCLQGGIHPDFDGDYYIDVTRAVHEVAPDIHIHGFTALEVSEGARRLGEPLPDYLRRLMAAGLRTLPGTAAEILDDEVRKILCPDKIRTDEWLDVHRTAHLVGLRSNITIMFGSIERPLSWVRHIMRTRSLQKETGGFTEFVPLPFVHMAAPIYLQRMARRGPTFREALLMHAVGRIAYGALVPNVQVSWVKMGIEGARQTLRSGANDVGGTLVDENISRAAGASHGQLMDRRGFEDLVAPLGRPLEQRTTVYGRITPEATTA